MRTTRVYLKIDSSVDRRIFIRQREDRNLSKCLCIPCLTSTHLVPAQVLTQCDRTNCPIDPIEALSRGASSTSIGKRSPPQSPQSCIARWSGSIQSVYNTEGSNDGQTEDAKQSHTPGIFNSRVMWSNPETTMQAFLDFCCLTIYL